ncbi:MAG: sugar isomerase domain-containing protein [Actinomycetota bacterium]
MTRTSTRKGGDAMRTHLQEVEERNQGVLEEVAERMHETVRSGGLIHTTGTGHSQAMVLETFYRAGGLACVRPIVHPALDPFGGAMASTRLERVEGLGALLVEAASPVSGETAFIFSNSGTNPVPVEMAEAFTAAGTTVVAVSSVEHMSRAPIRARHKLGDVADYVIDTGTPYGDAFWPTDDTVIAPLSSLTGTFVWNLLLIRVAAHAERDGTALPVWASANVEGGEERNRATRDRYRSRIPML